MIIKAPAPAKDVTYCTLKSVVCSCVICEGVVFEGVWYMYVIW